MKPADEFSQEKDELQAVLRSGIFNRAPNLENLLTYICGKYFQGASDEIKEYNIAVDAFGRSPEFDQKRDSIVRVEAHRLRKRLREYYSADGMDHELRIEIPSGQYTPQFVRSSPALVLAADRGEMDNFAPMALVPAEKVSAPVFPLQQAPRVQRFPRLAILAVALLTIGATIAVAVDRARSHPVLRGAESEVRSLPGDEVRILSGVETGSYVDAFERTWQSDRYFSGGYIGQSARLHPIVGTKDQRLYQSRREGGFSYAIPLKPGTYELKLYFAETVFGDNNVAGGGETSRMFKVTANGTTLLDMFDVISDAGSGAADIRVFKDIQPDRDGKLHLEFSPETNAAFVNAIEIVPAPVGYLRPVRIVARDRGLKDSENRYWDPDRYAMGGQIISRPDSPVKSGDPEIYRSERFGNITYVIPVAPSGRYAVNLYFTENWFGPGMPGGGGVGSRIFDILVNGVAVRRNFDIFRESGGLGQTTTVSLHGVEANHQGKVVISLTPARNYALVNALEVIDESR